MATQQRAPRQPATSTAELDAYYGCSEGAGGFYRDCEIVPGYRDTIKAIMAECLPKIGVQPTTQGKSRKAAKS